MPVSVAMPDPADRARPLERRPVIAVPDTAVSEHAWFPLEQPGQRRGARRSGAAAADNRPRLLRLAVSEGELVDPASVPDAQSAIGEVEPLTGARGRLEGHGTFIAGLLRQGCPEATILSVPVMGSDGTAEESDLLAALTALLARHIAGQEQGRPQDVIDVLSLSLGYYAEDSTYLSGPVAQLLARFSDHGVIVVAGVGNDASTRPFVPAALAAEVPASVRATSRPPLASVGATNPDGETIALFSNAPVIVSAYRPGVSLVSTMPALDGVGQSSVGVPDGQTPRRATVDPDSYLGGFGVWSGTSFATPVLAAELAAELTQADDLTDVSEAAMRKRAVKTLKTCLGKKA
jgi:subtilisin family serine protease